MKGHAGNPGNEGADTLAKQGAALPLEQATKPEICEDFHLTGACLKNINQSAMYKQIMARKARKPR